MKSLVDIYWSLQTLRFSLDLQLENFNKQIQCIIEDIRDLAEDITESDDGDCTTDEDFSVNR